MPVGFDFADRNIRQTIDAAFGKLRTALPSSESASIGGSVSKKQLEDSQQSNAFTVQEKDFFQHLLSHFDAMDNLAFGGNKDNLIGIYDVFKFEKGDINYEPPQVGANTGVIETYNGLNIDKTGMTEAQVSNLKRYIDFLSKDEDGSKLVKKVNETGPMTIKINSTLPNGSQISGKTMNLAPAMLDDLQKDNFGLIEGMMGFAHQYMIAATMTIDNGDSKNEQVLASVLGTRIAGRFYGKPQSLQDEQAVYDKWMNQMMKQDVYKNLPQDNTILADMPALGIKFDGLNIHAPVG